MSWDDLRGHGITAGLSRYDTARFGLGTARITVREGESSANHAAAEIARHVSQLDPEVAIIRWPARMTGLGQRLSRMGWELYPADTLVYWEAPTSGAFTSPPGFVSLENEPALIAQWPELVRDVFENYLNHYSASSQFDADDVLAGYVEWANRAAAESPARCFALVQGGEAMSLATTIVLADGSLEVELAGTVNRQRKSGHYRALVQGLLSEAFNLGAERLLISTQAANSAVQSAWVSSGFRPISAFTTIHAWPNGAHYN